MKFQKKSACNEDISVVTSEKIFHENSYDWTLKFVDSVSQNWEHFSPI